MHPLFFPVYILNRRIQEDTSPPKWTKHITQKVYVGHLHHYLKLVPVIWDPKTKVVSPHFHVMFEDNFDTVQAPDPNFKITDTTDRWFKTSRYQYDVPFGNEHTYLFFTGEKIYIQFSPNLKTCQESMTMTSTYNDKNSETPNDPSEENTHRNNSILSMRDFVILHANTIFQQNNKDDFKGYTHLHGIDMQIHPIPKQPKQKAHDMVLSDPNTHGEFKLFAMEYITKDNEPDNGRDHYVDTLQWSNEDYEPGFNDMFLNNLDPTFYAM
jgi:hypothetical protein